MYMLLLPEVQTGEAWEPSKPQCSLGNRGALDMKGHSHGLYLFKEINCIVCWIWFRIRIFPCVTAVFRDVGLCCFAVVLVVLFRQSFVINTQGVEKVTRHSMFHKRKAVLSDFCAPLCVKVKQFLNRPGQALRHQEVEAHRSYRKSTYEGGNVFSLIVKSWYLLYNSGHEISDPCNKSAHTFQPLICVSSKRSHGIFTNKWVFVH
jgi:hypothetical protein